MDKKIYGGDRVLLGEVGPRVGKSFTMRPSHYDAKITLSNFINLSGRQ